MSSTLSDNDIEAIRQLLKMVSGNNLTELSITVREGVSVTIKCEKAVVGYDQQLALPAPSHVQHPIHQLASQPQSVLPNTAPQPAEKKGTPVNSPATGIYYQSPSPGDPPFVKIGDTVQVGQVIGLLEAMKVFSDIASDVSGKVTEISAVDGALVRDGDPILFLS